ncbi:diguanylate cyclase [Heyndrickxia shackletonii]|uniref:Diguanylate cyclase n=1 Tax=Heyndrickxia shackletonii TaxID=157838 RepID=A0A0Q3TFE8_9BACI|nr:diguanylate cyclase [Heyndrickxia shackletonii]KQL52774.1 diguanylate cyclase [Heyndrickxia shackletonii]NEZ00094.1 diguanylate cyclase [Heyndrickxia shackletonii]
MDLSKYRNLLIKKIMEQVAEWCESDAEIMISNSEVHRFLHSIKGTSGTLELEGIHRISETLLEQLSSFHKKEWKGQELREFLSELMELTYSYGHFEEVEMKKQQSRNGDVPLIQIIDDDISILILLKDFLEKKGWMVITNSTSNKAVSQYFDLQPDCVVIDVNLPNKNGFEIIEDLQIHSNKHFVPIVMISVFNDRNTRIKAFKMGADDFIQKPIDLEEFAVRIERHLLRKQIYDQSVLLDELTNLYNRRYLKVVYDRSMEEWKRNNQQFSIAILDIDYFKKINDRYGHVTGDLVLSTFALFLAENTRSNDLVFRYGGEEFIILFQNTDYHKAYEIVSRLLADFTTKCFEANGEVFFVTFSAGITGICSKETTMDSAINAADQALYTAKNLGRSRVECFNQSLMEQKKLFISVIDDDPIIRSMLKSRLQEAEFNHYVSNIHTFENGPSFFQSGILEYPGEHFLILDGVMPIMDGIEVLQKVKQTERNNVSVIMLTGRNSEDDIAKALELGADDYMTKPFHMNDLQERIMRLIQRKK